jgi:hypothetical protein
MKNNKVKKKTDRKVAIKNQSIDVERKRDVVLVKSCIDKMTEDEIRELLIRVAKENKEIKDIYYSLNTQVAKTRQRSFGELIKKFVQQLGNDMDMKIEGVIVKYRRG